MSATQRSLNLINHPDQSHAPWWQRNISTVRIYSFFLMWATFAFWAFLIVSSSSHGDRALASAAGTITGPMVGAIARNFQPCCLTCSISILPYSATILLVGVVAQFEKLNLPWQKALTVLRILLWVTGWLGWFLGGTISFLHAMG